MAVSSQSGNKSIPQIFIYFLGYLIRMKFYELADGAEILFYLYN